MRRLAGSLIVLAALAAAPAAVVAEPASEPQRVAKKCARGYKHAVIGGVHRCLKAGIRCQRRLDRQYHRYGFHCHGARLTRRTSTPAPAPPAIARIVARVPLPAPPADVAATDDAIWVTTVLGQLHRIDPATNAVVATIGQPTEDRNPELAPHVAVGGGAVWVADARAGAVIRVDPATNRAVATIPIAASGDNLHRWLDDPVFAAGSLWVGLRFPVSGPPTAPPGVPTTFVFAVARISPATNSEIARVLLPVTFTNPSGGTACCGVGHLVERGGLVWGAFRFGAGALQIDPASNTAVRTIATATTAACGGIEADATGVWIASACSTRSIWHANAETGTVDATVDVPGGAAAVKVAFDSIWATTGSAGEAPGEFEPGENTLVRISPSTRRVLGKLTGLGGPSAIDAAAGSLWIAESGSNTVARVNPA